MQHREQSMEINPNLTPLLDLVLQLVMFFMITVDFVRADQMAEGILLPVAQMATPIDQTAEDWIFLNVDDNGKLKGLLENEGIDVSSGQGLGRLKAYLSVQKQKRERTAKELGKKSVNIVIVVRADKNARYEDVYRILDACSRVGYDRWQLRVLKAQ